MEAPIKVRDTIVSSGLCNSGGGFNHTASGLMTSIIELGLLQKMLKESRPVYRVGPFLFYFKHLSCKVAKISLFVLQEQCQSLCNTLKAEVPSVEMLVPSVSKLF